VEELNSILESRGLGRVEECGLFVDIWKVRHLTAGCPAISPIWFGSLFYITGWSMHIPWQSSHVTVLGKMGYKIDLFPRDWLSSLRVTKKGQV
jgi:hypothetical protein